MPGAGKQSPETQKQIKELLEAGFDPTTIHRRLKVGRSSIYRMKRSLQRHGTVRFDRFKFLTRCCFNILTHVS